MLTAVEMILQKHIQPEGPGKRMDSGRSLPVVEVLSGRDLARGKAMYVANALSVVP